MLNQWVRLNFLINAQSPDGKAHAALNPTAYGLCDGAHSEDDDDEVLVIDNKHGTIQVGDIMCHDNDVAQGMFYGDNDVYVQSITAQDADSATVVLGGWGDGGPGPGGAGVGPRLADNSFIAFVSPSTFGFGGKRKRSASYRPNDIHTPVDGTWGRLLISNTSDGRLIQRSGSAEADSEVD
jgi:hypothetical protein